MDISVGVSSSKLVIYFSHSPPTANANFPISSDGWWCQKFSNTVPHSECVNQTGSISRLLSVNLSPHLLINLQCKSFFMRDLRQRMALPWKFWPGLEEIKIVALQPDRSDLFTDMLRPVPFSLTSPTEKTVNVNCKISELQNFTSLVYHQNYKAGVSDNSSVRKNFVCLLMWRDDMLQLSVDS